MTRSAARAFAEATAAMVEHRDVTDTLAKLLAGCAELTGADAIGVLVRTAEGLELLSASSHRTAELELYQVQCDAGPCVEAARTGRRVSETSAEAIVARWGAVGQAIVSAGFQALHAAPMRWQGQLIGAMGTFRSGAGTRPEEDQQAEQSFADIASVVIVQTTINQQQLTERVSTALAGRTVIEQAKGVIAYLEEVDMATAYRRLQALAVKEGETLTVTANRVVEDAARR